LFIIITITNNNNEPTTLKLAAGSDEIATPVFQVEPHSSPAPDG
jgi:hypothetical protein